MNEKIHSFEGKTCFFFGIWPEQPAIFAQQQTIFVSLFLYETGLIV